MNTKKKLFRKPTRSKEHWTPLPFIIWTKTSMFVWIDMIVNDQMMTE